MQFSFAIFAALVFLCATAEHVMHVHNDCAFPVYPGILSNGGAAPPVHGGFRVDAGTSDSFTVENGWGGRVWGRTGCDPDGTNCDTGDCGALQCNGAGGAGPVSLAEFLLDWDSGNGPSVVDFYDVSLVDGYNLPLSITPLVSTYQDMKHADSAGFRCGVAGCSNDLNANCEPELSVKSSKTGKTVACQSACAHFQTDALCCRGEFALAGKCSPSPYSSVVKKSCPRAYSYAQDDAESTFVCGNVGAGITEYRITFCSTDLTQP